MRKSSSPQLYWVNKFRAVHKLLFSIGLGLIIFLLLLYFRFELMTGVMIAWDTFSLTLITLSWVTFFNTNSEELRSQAEKQDESRYAIFLIVLASVCVSLIGILVSMKNTHESLVHKELHTFFSMVGVGMSWFLLHTTFTLRYTHLYYSSTDELNHGGIEFPGKCDTPDYLDFAYFSFVIGMTSQVSDVQISSRAVRRVVLLHGLISFVFNAIIVALTISSLANLFQ